MSTRTSMILATGLEAIHVLYPEACISELQHDAVPIHKYSTFAEVFLPWFEYWVVGTTPSSG